jgi:lipid-A-disaccharide synthase
MSDQAPSVLIVAAENSSALYARRLLEHWKNQHLEINAFGVGDESMMALGFQAIGRAEDMAVVGFQEVLKHYFPIRRVFYDILDEAKKKKPRFALLLDYPGFNLRLAKELKKLGVTVVYYVSPQLWAWKKGRIKDVKKNVDRMFVVFPFEVDFYKSQGYEAEFVGHPLLDEIGPELSDPQNRKLKRSRYALNEDDIVLGLMPGSRISEIERNFSVQLETARWLRKSRPRLKVMVLAAPHLETDILRQYLSREDGSVLIVQDEPFAMVNLCDVILVASGTATVLVGLMQKPMVIMYKMTEISAWIARRLVTGTKYFGMVNLIFDRKVVPEMFQEEASPDKLGDALAEWIDHPEKRIEKVRELSALSPLLGDRGATARVAEKLKIYLDS